jgi:ATP-dependent protease ClpP protease subunit
MRTLRNRIDDENLLDMVPKNRHELLYAMQSEAAKYLRQNKDADPSQILEGLVPELVEMVPDAAFDPIQPWDKGILFYHQTVDEAEVVEFQHDLTRAHLNLDPLTPITLNLSSVGGSVFAGLTLVSTIYDLQRKGRKINVHIQGTAMSMASVIAQVANWRTIERGAFVMLHKISYGMGGSTDEHEEQLAFSRQLHGSMFSIYSARTGKPIEYYHQMLTRKNWYMTADEALAEGLVDAIVEPPLFNAPKQIFKRPSKPGSKVRAK